MPLRIISFTILLLLASLAGYFSVRQTGSRDLSRPASPLTISPETCDLGTMPQQAHSVARFQLTNNSPDAIEIAEVFTSCSCTQATVGKKQLANGETTGVEVGFDSGQARGDVAQEIRVLYILSDGTKHSRSLGIKAFVEADILTEPMRIDFSYGQSGRVTLNLRPGLLNEFEVKSAVATHGSLTVRRNEDSPRDLTVDYQPSENGDEASRSVAVVIETSSPKEPRLYVPVTFLKPGSPAER